MSSQKKSGTEDRYIRFSYVMPNIGWLVGFLNLTQTRVIWEEGILVKGLPPSNYIQINLWSIFLIKD